MAPWQLKTKVPDFHKLPKRIQDQIRTAREVANVRLRAERWAAKGNETRAAACLAEESLIRENARNFNMVPTDTQVKEAMVYERNRLADLDKAREEESKTLIDGDGS